MRHVGSAMLLGIILAMILMLVSWERPPQSGGMSGKTPFNRMLNQMEMFEAQPAH